MKIAKSYTRMTTEERKNIKEIRTSGGNKSKKAII